MFKYIDVVIDVWNFAQNGLFIVFDHQQQMGRFGYYVFFSPINLSHVQFIIGCLHY